MEAAGGRLKAEKEGRELDHFDAFLCHPRENLAMSRHSYEQACLCLCYGSTDYKDSGVSRGSILLKIWCKS